MTSSSTCHRSFAAQLGVRPETGGRGGVPILLGEPTNLADWDGSFMTYVEERLGAITWLGSTAWQEKGANGFYANFKLTDAGLGQDGTGDVKAFTISPGYCPPPGQTGEARSRRDGRFYRTDWQRMVAAGPSLILINSWNDFACGTEIAPSRQWGHQFVDATRTERARLGYQQPRRLRLLQHSTPEMLLPGAAYQVEFLIENDGTEDVVTGQRLTADYRITRRADGQVVSQTIAAQNLSVRAGEIRRTPVLIAAQDQTGKPLPPGDYVFTLVVMRSKVAYLRSPLVAKPEAELSVPFTVGAPPDYKGTVLLTSVPATLTAGTTDVVVRLRNDGAATWKASEAKLSSRLVFADGKTPEVLGEAVPFPQDVKPGEIVSVPLPVKIAEPSGEHARPGGPGELTWMFLPKGEADSPDLKEFRSESLALSSEAFTADISPTAPPREVTAGGKTDLVVEVTNTGTAPWPADSMMLTAAWYDGDGRRMQIAGRVKLGEVAPQLKSTATITLTAPAVPGSYWLAWGVAPEVAKLLSPAQAVLPMAVTGGSFRSLDLADLGNCMAVSTDGYRSQADFDGSGRSFPAECLPHEQAAGHATFCQAGSYSPAQAQAASFVYPNLDSGVGSGVACSNQVIALGENAHKVHLLLASAQGPQDIKVSLQSVDSADLGTVTVNVPSWREPGESAAVGAYCPYVRTLNGDEAAPAYLYHVILSPRTEGAAIAKMILPDAPAVRILAITVEE